MVTLDVRREVAAFALLMEAKLRENDHKRGWLHEKTGYLSRRCGNELDELRAEIKEWHRLRSNATAVEPLTAKLAAAVVRIGREAADVGAFAMMIADVCGALAAPCCTDAEGDAMNDDRKYPSDAILLAAGRAAWDWAEDTNGCHFCTLLNDDDEHGHDADCPLAAVPTLDEKEGR